MRTMSPRERAWYTELHKMGFDEWDAKYCATPIANDALNRWANEGFLRMKWVSVPGERNPDRTWKVEPQLYLKVTTFKKYTNKERT